MYAGKLITAYWRLACVSCLHSPSFSLLVNDASLAFSSLRDETRGTRLLKRWLICPFWIGAVFRHTPPPAWHSRSQQWRLCQWHNKQQLDQSFIDAFFRKARAGLPNALLLVIQIAVSFAEWKVLQGDRFVRSCMRDAFKVCGAEEFSVEKCQWMNGSLDNDIL